MEKPFFSRDLWKICGCFVRVYDLFCNSVLLRKIAQVEAYSFFFFCCWAGATMSQYVKFCFCSFIHGPLRPLFLCVSSQLSSTTKFSGHTVQIIAIWHAPTRAYNAPLLKFIWRAHRVRLWHIYDVCALLDCCARGRASRHPTPLLVQIPRHSSLSCYPIIRCGKGNRKT